MTIATLLASFAVAAGGAGLVRTDYTLQSAHARGAVTTAFVTTGINIPANSLVVVIASAIGSTSSSSIGGASITCTSSGITFTNRIFTATSTNWMYGASIFTFQTTTATTGTTFSLALNNGTAQGVETWDVKVFSFTGFNTTTPIAGAIAGVDTDGTGAASLTLGATPVAGDYLIAVNCALNNTTGAIATTPGAGWTEACDTYDDDWGHFQVQYLTGVTSTAVAWVDVGTPSGVALESRLCALIVKAA